MLYVHILQTQKIDLKIKTRLKHTWVFHWRLSNVKSLLLTRDTDNGIL
jgi:hypothetical protein